MLNVLTTHRHIVLFIFFMLLSIVLLSLTRPADTLLRSSNIMERGVLFVLKPFQSTVFRVFNEVRDVWESYIALVRLHEENQRLRTEISQLHAEKNQYIEKALEYDRLIGALNHIEERGLSAILARVIGNDATNLTNTIVIDKGSVHGVQENWPVITKDGIAGMTASVSRNSSKVLLLMDPNCSAAALVQRTRDQGVVSGHPEKEAYIMKYVNRRADIREGTIYELTDSALKELAKEGLPGFRLTDRAFPKLQEAGVPADTLIVLAGLQDLLYVSQENFVRALETTIGKEQTEQYKTSILEATFADVLAKLQNLKNQQYTTETDFLKALEATIGDEQTLRYKALISKHVQEKETVVSSGLGGIFPKGLLIGVVSKVSKQDYGLFQDIEVTPSVDFSKLEEVLIIRRDNAPTVP